MDLFETHIELTARGAAPDGTGDYARLVLACNKDQSRPVKPVASFRIAASAKDILRAAFTLLERSEFKIPGGIDNTRQSVAGYFERTYEKHQPPLRKVSRTLLPVAQLTLRIDASLQVLDPDGTVRLDANVPLSTWFKEFERDLRALVASSSGWATEHDPIRPPGWPPDGPWSGRLLDYSGCATFGEVAELSKSKGDDKVLPLGFYAWSPPRTGGGDQAEKPGIAPQPPRLLYLSRFANGGLMLFNGTLVVAPQNSGKTELIVRWAMAANAGGYHVFLVDVKGELFHRLKAEGLKGRILLFSTDPDPDIECDRLNLLDGLDCLTPEGRRRIAQLIEAMLPLSEVKDEEAREYWQLRARWMSAMINLLLLRDLLAPAPDPADLSALYEIAADEEALLKLIRVVKIGVDDQRQQGREVPYPPLKFWTTELLQLIDPENGGLRDPRHSYPQLMIGITTLLSPFSEAGVLRGRTSGYTDFRLEEVNGTTPVTIILAAREQDGEEAKTVLSLVIKRLEQIFYDRRKRPTATPVVLLLDETRRIRGFQPAEYITFARDARAGVVLVYQSLTQVRDPDRRIEILENVGTQIYLRSVTGETARQLIGLLPVRGRPTFSSSRTDTAQGGSESLQTGQEQVPYFSTAELYRLPAGSHPALVYIKDHGEGKPFLVNMDRDAIKGAISALEDGPRRGAGGRMTF